MRLICKITFSIIFLVLFFGCGSREPRVEVITKYKFIEKKCPCLKEYSISEKLKLELYNKGDLVCFVDGSGCIKKSKFKKIVSYIFEIKKINAKLNAEIFEFNKKFCKKVNNARSRN